MRKWLADRLDALEDEGKNRRGLAKHLGLDPARVSEMISGKRKIQAEELEPMAAYLEMTPDNLRRLNDGGGLSTETATGHGKEEATLRNAGIIPSGRTGGGGAMNDSAAALRLLVSALKLPEDVRLALGRAIIDTVANPDTGHPSRRARG